MYKIISILFVITLINAAAPVEYTEASAKLFSDGAKATLELANQAKITAAGLTNASQRLQTAALGAQKAAMDAYTAAVGTVGVENQKNLAQAALAGIAKSKYAGLLATTVVANAANELNKANVLAAAARKTNMALTTQILASQTSQTKALYDSVEVTGNAGLVGLTASFQTAFLAFKTYLDKMVTTATTATTAGTVKSDYDTEFGKLAASQAAMDATNQGTVCMKTKYDPITQYYASLYTKTVAYKSLTGALTDLTALQTGWVNEMGVAGPNMVMTKATTDVGKVKTALAAYKADIVAQSKVVTDQQAVVAALITALNNNVTPAATAWTNAKGASDGAATTNTNAKGTAASALSAYNGAVTNVVTTRGVRDSTATAAMTANMKLSLLQIAEATAVGALNYQTANLALANNVVTEVAARAAMRTNLVSAATAKATQVAQAAASAKTAAATAAAAAVVQATKQLGINTAAAVAAAKLATGKTDMMQMTKWNQSFALDALIAQKICNAAIAAASVKPTRI